MSNKRLSDIERFEHIGFFVKFIKKKYVQTLLNGDIFMNNFKCFIDIETDEQNRGQGDQYEGAHVIKSKNVKMYDIETNEEIATASLGVLIERNTAIEQIPLFCFTRFAASDFIVIEEDEETISFKLDLSEKDKNIFLHNFGDTVILLPGDFPQLVVNAANEQNLDLISRPVSYEDYNYFSRQRQKDFEEGSINILFTKDIFFESQREVRLVILNKQVETNMLLHVESLIDQIYVYDAKKYLNEIFIKFSKSTISN
jgi:hypothetical protein